VRQRYRRSLLGPFWLTLSMSIMIGALGLIYGRLFKADLDHYLPFLTLGLIVWGLISSLISEASGCFSTAAAYLKHSRLPKSLFVCRTVWRNLLMAAHNVVVYVVVAWIFDIEPSAWVLPLPFALAAIALNGAWIGLVLGMVSARFRDVPQIVANLLQVAFFLTPILFQREQLGAFQYLVDLNPFVPFIEIV